MTMPNRILKESICTSDTIDSLSMFQEVVFYRLIVNCDDFGRFDARPKVLSAKLFPLKDISPEQLSDAINGLCAAGLIIVYEVDGKPFLQVNTWDKHQSKRAKKSKYPPPSESTCMQMHADSSNGNQVNANVPVFENRESRIEESYSYSEARERARDAAPAPAPAPAASVQADNSQMPVAAYCAEYGIKLTAGHFEQLREFYEQGITDDMMRHAVDEAVANNAPTWAYVRKCLDAWIVEGYKTLDEVKAANGKKAKGIEGSKAPPGKPPDDDEPFMPQPRFFSEIWSKQ